MKVIIAGGGTGGHILPGLVLAEEIQRNNGKVLFVISRRAQDKMFLKDKGIPFKIVSIDSLESRSIISIIKFCYRFIVGTLEAFFIILQFRPYAIVGFGGYVSGPLIFLGRLLCKKTLIHEQNVYPGLTNRLLAYMADRVTISFEETRQYFKKTRHKIIFTGNPLRPDLKKEETDKRQDRFTLLVIGGSQGAHFLNVSVPEALGLLGEDKRRLKVLHIAGNKETKGVAESYMRLGITYNVFSFTTDMSRLYNECDFVIARSGAMTVSEIWQMGIPAILIPYPYAGGHQLFNAKALEKIGGAIVLEQFDTGVEDIYKVVRRLMDREVLNNMSARLRRHKLPDASKALTEVISSL